MINDMQPRIGQQRGAERKPAGRIVVAWHYDDLEPRRRPPGLAQEIVEQPNRLDGRNRPVVDIPGDEQNIGPHRPDLRDDAVEDKRLVLEKIPAMESFSEMKVGDMEKSHAARMWP